MCSLRCEAVSGCLGWPSSFLLSHFYRRQRQNKKGHRRPLHRLQSSRLKMSKRELEKIRPSSLTTRHCLFLFFLFFYSLPTKFQKLRLPSHQSVLWRQRCQRRNDAIATNRRCRAIKRRPRWRAAPGGVKGGRTCRVLPTVSVRPSLRPSVRLSHQTAAEPIIQSVSCPWRPDLLHTRTPPDCETEEIETFAGFFCSGANHRNLPPTISSTVLFLSKNNQKKQVL